MHFGNSKQTFLTLVAAVISVMFLAVVLVQWRAVPLSSVQGQYEVDIKSSKRSEMMTASPPKVSKQTLCQLDVFTREEVQKICSTSVPSPRCLVEHIGHLKPAVFSPATLRLPSGQSMKIFFNPKVEGMAERIASRGIWEKESVTLVMKALRAMPMSTALIDVGCNFGVYTLAAASLGHRVVAIDANYHLVMRTRKSVEANLLTGRVDVFWNAMSAERINVKMRHVGVCDFGLLQTYKSNQPGVTWTEDPVSVPGVGLDDVVMNIGSLKGIDNLVFKVDIEGSEWNVFATAARTFDRFNVSMVLMEWGFTKLNFAHKTQALCNFLTSRGFSAYDINGERPGVALRVEDRLNWPGDVLWLNKKSGLVNKLAG